MKTAAQWIFIICLPVMLLTAAIGTAANSLDYWLTDFGEERYDIGGRLESYGLPLEKPEIARAYHSLTTYFNSGGEYIELTVISNGESVRLFTDEETIHFRDVKGLIWLDYWLFIGTFLYILAYVLVNIFWLKDRRRLMWGLIYGGGLSVVLIAAVALMDVFWGFGELWYRFHLVFFSNEFWYAEGYMLRLFPQQFFADAAVFCGLFTAVGALIAGGIGWWVRKRESGIK